MASENITLKADFKKTVSNGRKELVKGIFYFVSPDRIFLDVRKPLKQDVIFEIEMPLAAHYSFYNTFLNLSLEKILLDMNYKLIRERRGEKIFSEYRPPKKISLIGTITIVKQQNKIVTITVQDRKRKVICETSCEDYLEFERIAFPKRIKTITCEPTGEVNRVSILYNNIKINSENLQYYTNFEFPEDVNIKK